MVMTGVPNSYRKLKDDKPVRVKALLEALRSELHPIQRELDMELFVEQLDVQLVKVEHAIQTGGRNHAN